MGEFSKICKLSETTIHYLEANKTKFSLFICNKLCQGFQIDISVFYEKKPKTFPEFVFYYRILMGLTRKQLADLIGRGKEAIRGYEKGINRPSLTTAYRLAEVFDMGIDELMKIVKGEEC